MKAVKTEAVLFVEDAEVNLASGKKLIYRKGENHTLRSDSAQRWYIRGKAEPAPVNTKPVVSEVKSDKKSEESAKAAAKKAADDEAAKEAADEAAKSAKK